MIYLAVLGLFLDDTLTRLNALKQCISLATNVAAAVFFLFSGLVIWPLAIIMAAGALIGGAIGGHVAGRITRPVMDHCRHRDGSRAVLPDPVIHVEDLRTGPFTKKRENERVRPDRHKARTSDRRVTRPASFPFSVIGTVLIFFATIRSTISR